MYVPPLLPQPNVARVRVTVSLVNAEAIRECSTAGDRHAGLLIVANLRNEILLRAKVKDAALLMSDGNRSAVIVMSSHQMTLIFKLSLVTGLRSRLRSGCSNICLSHSLIMRGNRQRS